MHNEYNQAIILNLANKPIITNTITPQSLMSALQWSASAARVFIGGNTFI
jgi:hypothetical protein